jgi:pimeloyl-ACP methyl ester carboxylesterase
LTSVFSTQPILATILNDSVPAGKNFNRAVFRLWYPDDYKSVAGIIVLMPGSNGDGRNQVADSLWQGLARKHGFALLGCWFTDFRHDDMMIESYANAAGGSGQALLDVLAGFAAESGFTEMTDAPLVLWGHSAGGQFNYEFACWKPERVIAFIVNKGGFYYTALAPKATRNIPGLFFTGEKDLDARKDIIKGIFSMNRRAGALWAFAEEPGAGHEVGNTMKMAAVFINEIIPLRLPRGPGGASSSRLLLPLTEKSGYIGDFKSGIIIAPSEIRSVDYTASWLPGPKSAAAWLAVIKKIPFR